MMVVKIKEYFYGLDDLLAPCVYKPSKEKLQIITDNYFEKDQKEMYVLEDKGEYLGVMGVEVSSDKIILQHLAVTEKHRGKGAGSILINHLRKVYPSLCIEAKTDKDAVDFYRKLGFSVKCLGEIHPGYPRYRCQINSSI